MNQRKWQQKQREEKAARSEASAAAHRQREALMQQLGQQVPLMPKQSPMGSDKGLMESYEAFKKGYEAFKNMFPHSPYQGAPPLPKAGELLPGGHARYWPEHLWNSFTRRCARCGIGTVPVNRDEPLRVAGDDQACYEYVDAA